MSKFQKRVKKLSNRLESAVIIGSGFGYLSDLLETFKTIFVLDDVVPSIKAKNLVYRENFGDFSSLPEINAVFFDRNKIDRLSHFQPLWNRPHTLVIIEGDEPISRDFSKSLYTAHFNCTGVHGFFHVWELIK